MMQGRSPVRDDVHDDALEASHAKRCSVKGSVLIVVDPSNIVTPGGVTARGRVDSIYKGPCYGFTILRGDYPDVLIAAGRPRVGSAVGVSESLPCVRTLSYHLEPTPEGLAPMDEIWLMAPSTVASGTIWIAVHTLPGRVMIDPCCNSLGLPTNRTVTLVAATTTNIFAANPNRHAAMMQLDPAAAAGTIVHVAHGRDAVAATADFALSVGSSFSWSRPEGNLYGGRIAVISTGTPRIFAWEANEP